MHMKIFSFFPQMHLDAEKSLHYIFACFKSFIIRAQEHL